MATLELSVYRYNPDVDDAPFMKDYTLEVEEGRDMMVLDALLMLKEQDPSLAFRRSCREGVCGSDGLNINGKNGLACITHLSETVKNNKLVLRPLPGGAHHGWSWTTGGNISSSRMTDRIPRIPPRIASSSKRRPTIASS